MNKTPRTGAGGGRGGGSAGRTGGCPICGRPGEARWRPFCSPRCADVDLGRWLGERYAVPGEAGDPDAIGSGGPDEGGPDDGGPDHGGRATPRIREGG